MSTEYKSVAKLDISDVKRGAKEAADSVNKIISAIRELTEPVKRIELAVTEISTKMANFSKTVDKTTSKMNKGKSAAENLKKEFENFEVTVKDEGLVEMRKELKELEKEQRAFKLADKGFGYEEYDQNAVRIREIAQATKAYEKELYKASDMARNANFAPDSGSITGQLVREKQNLKSLERAGMGANDASYDAQYQKVIQLTEAQRVYRKEMSAAALKNLTPGIEVSNQQIAEMTERLSKLKAEVKLLERAGFGPGFANYEKAIREINEITAKQKEYMAEISRPVTVNVDSKNLIAQKKQAEQDLKSLVNAGFGPGDANYNEQYQKVLQLTAAWKEFQKEQSSAARRGLIPDAEESNHEIAELTRRLQELKAERKQLEQAGVTWGFQDYEKIDAEISALEAKIQEYKKSLANTEPEEKTTSKLSTLGKVGKAAFAAITNPVKTISGKLSGLTGAAKSAGDGVGNAFKTMLKYTIGIRSLYLLVNKLRSALVAGFGNLTKESNQTNYALSTLKSSLTMLQNSFAAAFSPLVNTVAPMLASFIQTIADAISYVGAFFATLTGQGSYTRAVYNYQSIADSAGSAASGTDAANKAAEEYQKTLAGFDEITKLNDQNSGSSGGSGGSGAGGGTGSGVSFETVSIPNAVSQWAEKFKEAWERADFTEFGTIVGTKLKNALDSIDWPGIQEKCERVAKSVATFLNGFFETEDLGTSIGNTLGQAVNTALITMDTFFTEFHWRSLGTFVADKINGVFSSIDWSLAGKTISDGAKGVFNTITTALQNIQWRQIGEDIRTFLVSIDWVGIAQSAFTALGSAFGGLSAFISGLIGDALDNFYTKYIEPYVSQMEEAGENIVDGIFVGIGVAIGDAAKWIARNIFVPFIDGFKAAFGIHSPASAPELLEAAGYVGEGILNGILQPFKDIANWVKENILTPIANAVKKAPEAVLKFSATITTTLATLIKKFVGQTINFVANITTTLAALIKKFVGQTINFAANIVTTAAALVKKFVGYVIKFAASITTTVATLVKKFVGYTIKFKASISTTVKSLISKFTGQVISFKANITGFVGNIGTKLKTALGLKATGGMYRNGRWSPIQSYATGGLPNQGQMFIAREAGPELVGSIGSGTAVVNNDQIVASVSAGVYKAVLAAMSNSNGGRQSDTINVYVGNDKLVASVIRGVNDITARTGSCPIHV